MKKQRKSSLIFVGALVAAVSGFANPSLANGPNVHKGRAHVYKGLDSKSLEHVTSADALLDELKFDNVPPTRIWKLLEHGEKVECLNCIPRVSRLLFDSNAKTREISAWWLRRRVFGVFGPGEVYSRVLTTLSNPHESELRRSHAANALGEFLKPSGIAPVAKAALEDPSPRVRKAAVNALLRLNSEGPGHALGRALSDKDEGVRLAALKAAVSVNVFSGTEQLVTLFSDRSGAVRRRAAEAAGSMRLVDSVAGLLRLANEKHESDADVRNAAVWALGQIADPETKDALRSALDDSNSLVRGTAQIALRRL